jgi:outer membrane protein OmpA-like peptidoglycan-associated protein
MDAQEEKLARIPGTRVEQVGEDTLLVHFDSDLLFDDASAALSPDARAALEDMAVVLNDYPKTAVVIEGHTDSIGSEESNQSLSVRRAEAVKSYLVARGVNPERMAAIGFGETVPRTTNETESGGFFGNTVTTRGGHLLERRRGQSCDRARFVRRIRWASLSWPFARSVPRRRTATPISSSARKSSTPISAEEAISKNRTPWRS